MYVCIHMRAFVCIYHKNLKVIIEGKENDIKTVGGWTWVIE